MPDDSLLLARLSAALAAAVRVTAPRRAALASLAALPEREWSADELSADCNARQAGTISRASTYRVLELLRGLGLVELCAGAPGSPQRYRLTPPALLPVTLADAAGGKTLRLPADRWLKRYVERLALRHGLTLADFTLELRGSFKLQRARKRQ